LQEEHTNSKKAFQQHKKLENKLLKLLAEFNIPDSAVSYSLLNFRKSQNRRKEVVFLTNQEIIVKLNSIKDYSNFQLSLLNNNFDDFNAVFSSNDISNVKELGYKKALELAKEDASAIAKAMGKNIGEIVEVNTRTSERPHIDARRGSITALTVASSATDRGLTEIEQSLAVRTNLEVTFRIVD